MVNEQVILAEKNFPSNWSKVGVARTVVSWTSKNANGKQTFDPLKYQLFSLQALKILTK